MIAFEYVHSNNAKKIFFHSKYVIKQLSSMYTHVLSIDNTKDLYVMVVRSIIL